MSEVFVMERGLIQERRAYVIEMEEERLQVGTWC